MKNNNYLFNINNDEFDKITSEDNMDTDKARKKHYYTKWYNFYFNNIRLNKLSILEIGVAQGKSLRAWLKYFPNSNIYGIENNKLIIDKDIFEKCRIFIGDQSNLFFLNKVCKKVKNGFDIIIDDGSHITSDQVLTFEYLFKKLNYGGIYVIEDLQTSYKKSYKQGKYKSTVNFLKNRIDDVNYNGKFSCNSFEFLMKKNKKLNGYEKLIEGISFHAGICFIFKRYC